MVDMNISLCKISYYIILHCVRVVKWHSNNCIWTPGNLANLFYYYFLVYAETNNVNNGFFVDPMDCNKYYVALRGADKKYITYRFSCIAGMHFDMKTLACLPGDCKNQPGKYIQHAQMFMVINS